MLEKLLKPYKMRLLQLTKNKTKMEIDSDSDDGSDNAP